MLCKQCESQDAYIQQAEDSHYKEVRCPRCGWKQWLSQYNKNKINKEKDNENNMQLVQERSTQYMYGL